MYVISCGGDFIIVDPSVEPGAVSRSVEGFAPDRVCAVLITHAHYDHISCAPSWQRILNDVPFIMSDTDKVLLSDCYSNCSSMIGDETLFDIVTEDISALPQLFGDDHPLFIKGIPTPGHTAGSVTYQFIDRKSGETVLFSGDTVFMGSVGRTDFPTGNVSDLMASIEIYKGYPANTVIYPGHGPKTNVGIENEINPFF